MVISPIHSKLSRIIYIFGSCVPAREATHDKLPVYTVDWFQLDGDADVSCIIT